MKFKSRFFCLWEKNVLMVRDSWVHIHPGYSHFPFTPKISYQVTCNLWLWLCNKVYCLSFPILNMISHFSRSCFFPFFMFVSFLKNPFNFLFAGVSFLRGVKIVVADFLALFTFLPSLDCDYRLSLCWRWQN